MIYSPTFGGFLWFSCRWTYQSHGSLWSWQVRLSLWKSSLDRGIYHQAPKSWGRKHRCLTVGVSAQSLDTRSSWKPPKVASKWSIKVPLENLPPHFLPDSPKCHITIHHRIFHSADGIRISQLSSWAISLRHASARSNSLWWKTVGSHSAYGLAKSN